MKNKNAENKRIQDRQMKKLEEEKARLDSYFDGAGEMLKNKEKELDSLFEKEKKRLVYRVFFDIGGVFHIYRSNAPAYVCIKRVITRKNSDFPHGTKVANFKVGVTSFNSQGLSFLVERNDNSVVV